MIYNKKFYEKHGLKITDEPVVTHDDKHLMDISERIFHTLQDSKAASPHLIKELEDYIVRYPSVKSFKNYLYIAYTYTNQKEKAMDLLHKTLKLHPDYIFGYLNLANQYILEKNYIKAAAILKEPYDIRHFETDEFIHVSAFNAYYTTAIRLELERNNPEEAERLHRILFDYDPKGKMVKELGMRILMERMKKNTLSKPKNERKLTVFSKSIQRNYLSDSNGKPVFNHLEIQQLYRFGVDNMPKRVIEQILALPRQTLIQDLEHCFSDTILRYEYFEKREWKENEFEFFLHALYLLTELKSYDSLPIVLDFLRQDEDFMRFWMGDFLENHFHPTVYLLAHNQLDSLKKYVFEENNYPWFRLIASEVAAQVALKQPERRGEVIQWFKDVIQFHLDNANNDNLIDTRFLSSMLGDLMHIGAVELIDDVKALFATGWIDDKFCGDLKEVLEDIQDPDMNFHNKPLPVDIYEMYSKEYEKRQSKSKKGIDPKLLEILNDPYHNFLTNIMTETLTKKNNPDLNEDDDDDKWVPKLPVKRAEPKVGRNDPCPCGSGKKYKKCHGQ